MRKASIWNTIGKLADVTQLLFAQPIVIGISWFFGVLGQSVPFISTLGLFGIGVISLGCYLALSICNKLQPKPKRRAKIETEPGRGFYRTLQWRGWKWVIGISFIAASIPLIEIRPRLPLGVTKKSIRHPIASHSEMKQGAITGRSVVINMVPRDDADHPMRIVNKHFVQCQIIGPAVVTRLDGLKIELCSFEAVTGLDDILLETKSKMVAGMIVLKDCEFTQCSFMGISWVGDSKDLDEMRRNIGMEPNK